MTYGSSDFSKFVSSFFAGIFDHVIAEESHGEVVITADDAGEHTDAGDAKKEILHDFRAFHF